ncbi:hypothetical protein ACIA5D_45115 [Actinoplanes sp. NPDC051513]|uniref:hypothetical protein n=1 Tax=Actinoplanes sp. NPDC051513 TaxID=3363908 RepID=UPI00379121BD
MSRRRGPPGSGGRTAIDLLVARLADPDRPIQTVTVPVSLIPRGSGETPGR